MLCESGIYAIEDLKGRLYYGSAINFANRWGRHIDALNANYHGNAKLQNAWNKYGEDFFKFYIVEFVEDKSKLIEREQEWLDRLFSTGDWCYNICRIAGSTLGIKYSEESKKKISEKAKGRPSSMKGKKFSNAVRKNMSDAKKGKMPLVHILNDFKLAETTKIEIALKRSGGKIYTLIGPDGTVYDNVINLNAFSREYNLDTSTLAKMVKGKYESHKGFRLLSIEILEEYKKV